MSFYLLFSTIKQKGTKNFALSSGTTINGIYFLMEDALVSKVEKKFAAERETYILLYALKAEKQDRNIRHNISLPKKTYQRKTTQD